MIDGFMRLMASDAAITGPVNIGNPVEFSMIELAELVLELTGSSVPLVRLPLSQDDPRQRCPDITKARTQLGWEPKVALPEGLERTIAFFRERLGELDRRPA